MQYTSLIFLIVSFALLCQAKYFDLDQKVFETLPKLPKSFSDEEWTRVQQAIQDAISCKDENPNWNKTLEVDLNPVGYPNCITDQSSRKSTFQKPSEVITCSKIPKIIHQLWKNETVPEEWKEYHEGWRKINPDWVLLLWTDQDQTEWIKANYDWFIEIYRNFPYEVERADAFRYLLMWAYGGVYVDIDYECNRPLSEYIAEIRKPVSMVSPHDDHFSNSMIISVPKHELWGTAIEQIYQNPSYFYAVTKQQHIAYTTGPKFLQNIIRNTNYGQDICSLQKSLFHPCSNCDSSEECQASCELENCYASQHYESSWSDFPSNLINMGKCSAPTTLIGIVELVVPSVLLMIGLLIKRKWHRRRRDLKKRTQLAC